MLLCHRLPQNQVPLKAHVRALCSKRKRRFRPALSRQGQVDQGDERAYELESALGSSVLAHTPFSAG
jgi:hypothetical protein